MLLLYGSPPRLLWSAFPLKGQAGDVGDRFPQSVANPFSSPYGNFNPLLLGALPQLLIGDLPWPPHPYDVPEPTIGESLKLGNDLLC